MISLDNLNIAMEKLKAIERRKCFDAFKPDTRPTEKQLDVFKDIATISI
jgi:hypothetical protein